MRITTHTDKKMLSDQSGEFVYAEITEIHLSIKCWMSIKKGFFAAQSSQGRLEMICIRLSP